MPISLNWFNGAYEQPVIHKTPFYWYVFAVPNLGRYHADHYFVCDYLQMREWVLGFAAPLGNDHRDHATWRADLLLYPGERAGYFRWGDEPAGTGEQPGVDVMFTNHQPDRTVVEIEVDGEQHVCIGIHQAIKYRSLAAADAGYPLLTSRGRSLVVAYDTAYPNARDLSDRYGVPLIAVGKDRVLSPAS